MPLINRNIKKIIRILYLIDPISNFDQIFTRAMIMYVVPSLHSVRSFI